MTVIAIATRAFSDRTVIALIFSMKNIANSTNCANQTPATVQLGAQMADMNIEKAVIGRGFALKQQRRDFFP